MSAVTVKKPYGCGDKGLPEHIMNDNNNNKFT